MSTLRTLTGLLAAGLLMTAAPAGAQDPTVMETELERTANFNSEQRVAYVGTSIAEITDAVKTITRLLENAKKDSDVEAIQCLTSRLTAVRALLSVAQNAESAMNSAMAGGEAAKAEHEFRRVAVAVSKTRMLLAEAQRCSASQAVANGDTIVEATEDVLTDPAGEDPGDLGTIGEDVPDVTIFSL